MGKVGEPAVGYPVRVVPSLGDEAEMKRTWPRGDHLWPSRDFGWKWLVGLGEGCGRWIRRGFRIGYPDLGGYEGIKAGAEGSGL